MKKTYIAPELLIVRVATGCQVCTASPTGTNLDGVTEKSNDPGHFSRRRRRNDWEDDWDEEEEW